MHILHKPINFEDARGTIRDIFVAEPKEHCTIITTTKGSVRGNHYHKVSRQHDYVVAGRMKIYGQKVGERDITQAEIGPGDLVIWKPNEAHEFVALEDVIFITFVDGVRGGDEYEKDTFRLEVPLHTLAEQAKKPL